MGNIINQTNRKSMNKIAIAALVAVYANAWDWDTLIQDAVAEESAAQDTLANAVKTVKAAEVEVTVQNATPTAVADGAIHTAWCKLAFEREAALFASCAHAALADYLEGHFGDSAAMEALNRWNIAYSSCNTDLGGTVPMLAYEGVACSMYTVP